MISSANIINCATILTGMSHEMRTHMNAIVAFSFLMKENCGNNTESEEFSNQILSSCEQLIGLFDSFLDSAILDIGSLKTDLKICKLNNILEDLFSEFREAINKDGHKELELITEVQYSEHTEVKTDKNSIIRVVRSLFQNALKNTKSGYIKIGYYFMEDKITFYVLDSGQSYFKCKEFLQSEDMNESLFLHNDTFSAINITLAKKIIHMLNGTIWIESNGLSGSGMYFSVPAKSVENYCLNTSNYVNKMIAI